MKTKHNKISTITRFRNGAFLFTGTVCLRDTLYV